MFVGHGLLAFALVALGGRALGWSRERTLTVAILAFAFGTVPDVDIAYAPVGLLGGVTGVFDAAEAFWQTGNVVHRAMTHSLPVALVAALAFGLWSVRYQTDAFDRTRRRGAALFAVGLLASLVAVATAVTGGLAGVVLTLFAAVGLAATTLAARRGVGPVVVWATALFGLVSHPFGDMLTGEPPVLLYPFETTVVAERVALHPDPTLHLLGAFAVELATVWLAAYAALSLYDRRLRNHVRPRAAVGFGYAAAAVALPAPTLAASYQFVFSILALGMVGPVRAARHDGHRFRTVLFRRRPARTDLPTAVVTGLTAVTLGAVGYTMAYLVL